MLVLIDGDPIVYRAGFAGESTEYHCVFSDEENKIKQVIFRRSGEPTPLKMKKKWMEENPEWELIDEEKVIVPEPLGNVLYTVKQMIRKTLWAIEKKFNIDPFDLHVRVLLSGPDNFRNDIATVLPYKGNRDEATKPQWYQQIRNYLTEQFNAEVIHGREADDELSIAQLAHDGDSIICTIDKDLDMVPGHHYDYVRDTFYYTTEDEGKLLFYKQILSGDSTDNIPGCWKIGIKLAANIIDNVYLDHGMDHTIIWQTILETYKNSLDNYGDVCPYYQLAETEGVEAVVIEMARLVKMQEYEGQLWTPEGQADELLEEAV